MTMLGVVPAGGEGTRLRPLTEDRPKPFVPILGRPCIDYALDLLGSVGIKDVLMTTYYRPEMLIEHLGGGSSHGMNIVYSIEDDARGTAGGVAKGRRFINETFIVVSGDLFVDADLTPLLEFHKKRKAMVTMALTEVLNPTEYGIVGLDDDGMIVKFKEKPKEEEVFSNLINAGIYIIEPEVLDLIPENEKFDFSKQLFPKVMEQDGLFGFNLEGLWIDIGRPSDLISANREMARKRLKEADGDLQKSGLIHPDARIDGDVAGISYIASGAAIGRNSIVENGFIHSGVKISEDAKVENSLLLEGTRIARKCSVKDTILGTECDIRKSTSLEECVLGDSVVIPSGSWLVRQKKG